jgi:hypothetical protein
METDGDRGGGGGERVGGVREEKDALELCMDCGRWK